MGRRTLGTLIAWGLAAAVVPTTLASNIAFDNMTNGYKPYGVWTGTMQLPGLPGWTTKWNGVDFTPSQGGWLSDIWAGMDLASGPNTMTLVLCADNGGVPGDVLWQQTYQNALGTAYGSVLHVGSDMFPIWNPPELTAGTRYWLEAKAPVVEGLQYTWYANAAGDTGSQVTYSSQTGNTVLYNDAERMAFRVGVVPLPAAAWAGIALLSALGVATGLRRRPHKAA